MGNVNIDSFIGMELGGVTLLSLLGRGHTGTVFTGFQKSLKRKIAVKLVPKDKMTAQSFMDEAEVIAVLNHPNIVTVFDVGEYEDYLYITMQLIEGDSLQDIMKRRLLHPVPSQRVLDTATVIRTMTDTLDALAYAHAEGVIHQDVKPGNILLDKISRRPYLVDFGIARTELTEDESTFIHGTPLYISPEQARGEPTDARADVYSAGVVLWECLSGKLPVPALPAVKLVGLKAREPQLFYQQTPSQSSPRINSEMEQIIFKAIAPEKNARYENCLLFRNDLEKYAAGKF